MEALAKLFSDAIGGAIDKVVNPITVGTILLFCAAVLLLPDRVLEALSIQTIVAAQKHYFGAGLLVCGCYFVVHAVRWATAQISATREQKRKAREVQAEFAKRDSLRADFVAKLTVDELKRVRPFIVDGVAAVHYPTDDGPAARLVAGNVLTVYAKTFDMLLGPPHSITPWARELLLARQDELQKLQPYKRPRLY